MPVTLPQRRRALIQANRVRLAMCAIKFELATGAIDIRMALRDPRSDSMEVARLIRCIPRWGDRRTNQLLSRLEIRSNKPCRELTPRQRDAIADTINGQGGM